MADKTTPTNMPGNLVFESSPTAAPTTFVSPVNQHVYLWFTVALLATGLCGNTIIIIAFTLFKKLRSLGSIFIVNTAVADICIGLSGDLFIVVGIATKGAFLLNSQFLCDFSSYICMSVCIVSIWSIAAACFNGYVRVCHHHVYYKIYTPATVTLMLVAVWAAGFLILLPTVLGWGSHYYDPILMYCLTHRYSHVSYTYFLVLVGLGLPFMVIAYSFTRIISTVRKSRKNLNKGKGVSKSEIQLIQSVIVIAAYFFTAFAFIGVIYLMGENYIAENSPRSYVFAIVLAHSHCSFSGILYAMTNKRFRDAYKKMFCFCWRRRGKVGVESTTSGSTSGMSSARTVSGAVTSVTNA